MGFVKVNDINLHYEIQGEGPRLLFIHGIGADLKNPISIFNTPVPQHFSTLAFDPRGLGESDSVEQPYTVADMAEDAAGLAAALGWNKFHVLAASMGGMVAQELVLHHPDRVNKLVMVVTNPGGNCGAPVLADKLFNMTTLESLRTSDTRQDKAWAAAHPELVQLAEQQAQAAKEAALANPKQAQGFAYQVQAVLKHDTYDRLAQIQADTLVINGRFDGSTPPEVAAEMARRIPHARFELVDHGHGSWYPDPAVWALIIEFLK